MTVLGGRLLRAETKEYVEFVVLKVVAVVKKFSQWSFARVFTCTFYETEKQNGFLQSGRVQEVVAYEKWSL